MGKSVVKWSVKGGETGLGCNSPLKSKGAYKDKRSLCYSLWSEQLCTELMRWFLEDWRKSGGWSKCTWPDWNKAFKSVKGHQMTLNHTWRDHSERDRHLEPVWQQCFSCSRATMMFTAAINCVLFYREHHQHNTVDYSGIYIVTY